MHDGVKEVFSLSQWAEKPPRKPPTASVSQWMLPTLSLVQKHSQLGNGHYERKIMTQYFSLSGTMVLFSLHHGMSRRDRAAKLYFWTWSSITERLCVMCKWQEWLGAFCHVRVCLLLTSTFAVLLSLFNTSAFSLLHQSGSFSWYRRR